MFNTNTDLDSIQKHPCWFQRDGLYTTNLQTKENKTIGKSNTKTLQTKEKNKSQKYRTKQTESKRNMQDSFQKQGWMNIIMGQGHQYLSMDEKVKKSKVKLKVKDTDEEHELRKQRLTCTPPLSGTETESHANE